MLADPKRPSISLRSPAMAGAIGSVALLVLLILWASFTQIAGSVVAQGTVAVTGKPKAVQHLDGGIVQEILVSDGDLVAQGDVLMRLDSTLLSANLEIYRNRLAEAAARRDRLMSERNGAAEPVFSPPHPLLQGRDTTPIQEGERSVFAARAEIQVGRRAQLEERIRQFRNQTAGVTALMAAKQDQIGFIEQELTTLRSLQEKKLVRDSEVLVLEGRRADLLGQVAEHITEAARIENSVRDAELEIKQTDRQFKEQAVTELRDVTVQIEELIQQIITTEKQLERIDITAPVRGYVHEMQIVTVGGVVPPGATIGQIISLEASHSFEFQVSPVSVDQVYPGQPVRLRFSAFNQRTTPEVNGIVATMSPTTVVNEATGQSFYRVAVRVDPAELGKLGTLELVPGMPVEGYIGTNERSVASYLFRPIVQQFHRAFREE